MCRDWETHCAGLWGGSGRWWLQVYRLLHHHLPPSPPPSPSVCLCRMEEVEIRPAWTLLATGGKSVSRLPSEYMITLVISQTKSRLGARRSRDEKTEKPDRASSFVTDITLPSSPLIRRTENQHRQSDSELELLDKHCQSSDSPDHQYFTLYLSNYGFIQRRLYISISLCVL